ncbi:RagB/SusD family nutrient uptake outer membrane protein [Dysgonomonas macrotermitis]|uniref:Starch-binding associating with outer membrane n=1 Tax=Dysgonomonas macrotermitis TaxID=1346286 RepID=A0A1M4VXU2_9BACT|nr:RagB/SusD family nutrient uptake outer membrane protein [Dysgonomonas macrotermitis]SHE73720.1 Starch-binding associating with outer membrane [Dysgonomonas macrotermitis]
MRTTKILCATLLSGLILFSGCSDTFLEDKKQYGKFDEKTVFLTDQTIGWYVDRIYYDFYYGYNSPGKNIVGLWEDRTSWTEEKGGITDLLNPKMEKTKTDECPNYFGGAITSGTNNYTYTKIRNCNFLLERVDELAGSTVTTSAKDLAKGQMYFLRGVQYFDLMRMYGEVPIVTEVEIASSIDESIKHPRASVSEVVKQIIADLDAAASLLPMTWDAANRGRFSKAAALAMKSRVLLTYASPLFNKDWDNPNNERWAAALAAGKEAEEALGTEYGLYGEDNPGNNAKAWGEMFLIDQGATFCKEAIMVKLLSSNTSAAENNGWENSIRLLSQGGSGGLKAPKEMIDLFPMKDGKRPDDPTSGYDEFKFFLNRDPRFYRTFAFSGSKWDYKGTEDEVWAYRWGDNGSFSYSDGNTGVNSPAFVRKMSDPKADNADFKYSTTDIMEYRYAELLLNIAECYAAKDDKVNSLAYLKRIRKRVGIPEGSANYGLGTFSNKYDALRACLYERQVELAYEGKRWFDIQRWMLYNDDNSTAIVSANNTCAKLGVTPLNSTCRTGHYLQYNVSTTSGDDPLLSIRPTAVNPDAGTFDADLKTLAQFYQDHFVLVEPEVAMDNYNNEPVNILWRQRYYIYGLDRTALSQNTWLTQTIGWLDANSADGTSRYQE